MGEAEFILDRLRERGEQPAVFWRGEAFSGSWIANQASADIDLLSSHGIGPGAVVLLRADYAPRTVSLLLGLIELNTILAPLLPSTLAKTPSVAGVVDPEFEVQQGPE